MGGESEVSLFCCGEQTILEPDISRPPSPPHPASVQTLSPSTRLRLRQALVLGIGVYGIVCLRTPGTYRLLDNVDLAIHETGHLVFAPFGELVAVFGGTLMQLIMPLAFVVSFWRRKDHFAASIVLAWVAQNLWNISVYVADARAQELPLVGGGEHDWAFILGHYAMLQHDESIARAVHFAGVAIFALAMLRAWLHVGPEPAAQDQPGQSADAPGASHPRT